MKNHADLQQMTRNPKTVLNQGPETAEEGITSLRE